MPDYETIIRRRLAERRRELRALLAYMAIRDGLVTEASELSAIASARAGLEAAGSDPAPYFVAEALPDDVLTQLVARYADAVWEGASYSDHEDYDSAQGAAAELESLLTELGFEVEA